MSKTIMIFSHSNFQHSLANRAIVEEIHKRDKNLQIRNIDMMYMDYNIDVKAEQKALLGADNVIFQFPVNWYNVPFMMKKWIDEVWIHDFLFGSDGSRLRGKNFIISTTAGGMEEKYTPKGQNGHNLEDFFLFMRTMADYVQMNYRGLVASFNMAAAPSDQKKREKILEKSVAHVDRLSKIISNSL